MNEEMNSKKSNVSIIYIIIIVLLLAVIGVLVFKQLDNKKEDTNNTQENTNNNTVMDNNTAKALIDKYFNDSDVVIYNIKNNGLTDSIKLKIAITRYTGVAGTSYSDGATLCEDAFDVPASGQYTVTEMSRYGCTKGSSLNTINYSSINNEYKKLFGSSNEAPKIQAEYNYNYSSKLNKYVNIMAFGTEVNYKNLYDVISVKENGNNLVIKIKYLSYYYYPFIENSSYQVYGGPEFASNLSDLNEILESSNNTIEFNFEKQNGEYILVSAK